MVGCQGDWIAGANGVATGRQAEDVVVCRQRRGIGAQHLQTVPQEQQVGVVDVPVPVKVGRRVELSVIARQDLAEQNDVGSVDPAVKIQVAQAGPLNGRGVLAGETLNAKVAGLVEERVRARDQGSGGRLKIIA